MDKNSLAFLSQNLVFWKDLTAEERHETENCTLSLTYPKGKKLYSGSGECLGLVLVREGQLRAFIMSRDGKEISLFRLLSMDVCILSASCTIKNLNFDVHVEAEKDSSVLVLPSDCFYRLSNSNIAVKNFALELMSARFSEVMWVFDQYVFGSAAGRLAAFLLDQAGREGGDTLVITHEKIANDLGTAREVVTRLLRHFANDGAVSLGRGTIRIIDEEKLHRLAE